MATVWVWNIPQRRLILRWLLLGGGRNFKRYATLVRGLGSYALKGDYGTPLSLFQVLVMREAALPHTPCHDVLP
jgi:hypothetical protein